LLLIQETTYQSLLKSTRQQYQQYIAQGLVERFPEIAKTPPKRLAHYYTELSLAELAAGYWQQAGQHRHVLLPGPLHPGGFYPTPSCAVCPAPVVVTRCRHRP
jgi:hypothetical protein